MYVQFNQDTRDMKISFLVLVLGITTIFGLNIKPKIETQPNHGLNAKAKNETQPNLLFDQLNNVIHIQIRDVQILFISLSISDFCTFFHLLITRAQSFT